MEFHFGFVVSVGTSEWSDLFGSAGKLCSVQPASSSAARSPLSPPAVKKMIASTIASATTPEPAITARRRR